MSLALPLACGTIPGMSLAWPPMWHVSQIPGMSLACGTHVGMCHKSLACPWHVAPMWACGTNPWHVPGMWHPCGHVAQIPGMSLACGTHVGMWHKSLACPWHVAPMWACGTNPWHVPGMWHPCGHVAQIPGMSLACGTHVGMWHKSLACPWHVAPMWACGTNPWHVPGMWHPCGHVAQIPGMSLACGTHVGMWHKSLACPWHVAPMQKLPTISFQQAQDLFHAAYMVLGPSLPMALPLLARWTVQARRNLGPRDCGPEDKTEVAVCMSNTMRASGSELLDPLLMEDITMAVSMCMSDILGDVQLTSWLLSSFLCLFTPAVPLSLPSLPNHLSLHAVLPPAVAASTLQQHLFACSVHSASLGLQLGKASVLHSASAASKQSRAGEPLTSVDSILAWARVVRVGLTTHAGGPAKPSQPMESPAHAGVPAKPSQRMGSPDHPGAPASPLHGMDVSEFGSGIPDTAPVNHAGANAAGQGRPSDPAPLDRAAAKVPGQGRLSDTAPDDHAAANAMYPTAVDNIAERPSDTAPLKHAAANAPGQGRPSDSAPVNHAAANVPAQGNSSAADCISEGLLPCATLLLATGLLEGLLGGMQQLSNNISLQSALQETFQPVILVLTSAVQVGLAKGCYLAMQLASLMPAGTPRRDPKGCPRPPGVPQATACALPGSELLMWAAGWSYAKLNAGGLTTTLSDLLLPQGPATNQLTGLAVRAMFGSALCLGPLLCCMLQTPPAHAHSHIPTSSSVSLTAAAALPTPGPAASTESVAPESVAPESMAPESKAPESVAPESVATESVAQASAAVTSTASAWLHHHCNNVVPPYSDIPLLARCTINAIQEAARDSSRASPPSPSLSSMHQQGPKHAPSTSLHHAPVCTNRVCDMHAPHPLLPSVLSTLMDCTASFNAQYSALVLVSPAGWVQALGQSHLLLSELLQKAYVCTASICQALLDAWPKPELHSSHTASPRAQAQAQAHSEGGLAHTSPHTGPGEGSQALASLQDHPGGGPTLAHPHTRPGEVSHTLASPVTWPGEGSNTHAERGTLSDYYVAAAAMLGVMSHMNFCRVEGLPLSIELPKRLASLVAESAPACSLIATMLPQEDILSQILPSTIGPQPRWKQDLVTLSWIMSVLPIAALCSPKSLDPMLSSSKLLPFLFLFIQHPQDAVALAAHNSLGSLLAGMSEAGHADLVSLAMPAFLNATLPSSMSHFNPDDNAHLCATNEKARQDPRPDQGHGDGGVETKSLGQAGVAATLPKLNPGTRLAALAVSLLFVCEFDMLRPVAAAVANMIGPPVPRPMTMYGKLIFLVGSTNNF
eukprot:gene25847-11519_t